MSKKNEITVNVHGLLGETGCVQIKLPEDRINEGDKFIYEKIGYQITRKIEEDVEHPILYVIVLDIFV